MIINPSEKDLTKLKGIIYLIRNKVDGKCYVGQTKHSFVERYSYEWTKSINTLYLKNAIEKYGKDNFEVNILEHSIKTIEELNRLEEENAVKYNCYSPNGYNLRCCGNNYYKIITPEQLKILKNINAKTVKVKNIKTGEIIEIHNISDFCRDKNITIGPLHRVLNESVGFKCGEYVLPETEIYDINNRPFYTRHNLYPPYKLYDLYQNEYIFMDLRYFAKENGLKLTQLMKLLLGKVLSYKKFCKIPVFFDIPYEAEWEIHDYNNRLIKKSQKIYKDVSQITNKGNFINYSAGIKFNNKIYSKVFYDKIEAALYRDKLHYYLNKSLEDLNFPEIAENLDFDWCKNELDNIHLKKYKRKTNLVFFDKKKNKWAFIYYCDANNKNKCQKDFNFEEEAKLFSAEFLYIYKPAGRFVDYKVSNKKEERLFYQNLVRDFIKKREILSNTFISQNNSLDPILTF